MREAFTHVQYLVLVFLLIQAERLGEVPCVVQADIVGSAQVVPILAQGPLLGNADCFVQVTILDFATPLIQVSPFDYVHFIIHAE